MPPDDGTEGPPGLEGISNEEFRQVYATLVQIAHAILKSKPRADELVHRTCLKLMTTRRWDATGPFVDYAVGAMKSELSNSFTSKAGEKAEKAADGHQREVVGRDHAPSPEEATLEQARIEQQQGEADDELDRLAARVAKNETLAAVLRCRRDGMVKPSVIAEELKLPVTAVYKANELLRYHLKKMREGQPPRAEDDAEEREVT